MAKPKVNKQDKVFEELTNKIIDGLEDAGKWSKPWKMGIDAGWPFNALTGRHYRGINVLILGMAGMPFSANGWMTFNQAKQVGSVRKGEKGETVVLWVPTTREDENGKEKKSLFSRAFTVFNVDQIDVDEDKAHLLKVPVKPVMPKGGLMTVAENIGVKVTMGGNTACFIPSMDIIKMPAKESFDTEAHFDATLAHEIAHATGSKDRLNRLSGGRFGSEGYAEEELVAELSACFMGSMLGLPYEGLMHTEYLANWSARLKESKTAIRSAAQEAQRVVDYLQEHGGFIEILPESEELSKEAA
jgi:antirestriction protein ArdC